MLPEHFYMTDLGKMAYVVLYLPLVLGLLWFFYRKIFRKARLAWLAMVVLAFPLLTLPFWDVYMISRDAERLCKEQGGLHVYKTVEAEGFLGSSSMKFWSEYGYQYVENGGGEKMSRYTMQNGKVTHQRIQKFISRYASGTGDNHKIISKSISRSSEQTFDLQTNEILGELVIFNIHPGRFDGILLRLAGSGPVVWHCGNEPFTGTKDKTNLVDVVLSTIKPTTNTGGEK